MQQQIKLPQLIQGNENPENQKESKQLSKAKQKKKKFKIKKVKKSQTKHQFSPTAHNPLYAGLQSDQLIKSNQLNFGPWIHQEIKAKDENSIGLQQYGKIRFNDHQKQVKLNFCKSSQVSKSAQILPKFQTQINSNKVQKSLKKNSTSYRIPFWNAFIKQQTAIVPNHQNQDFHQRKKSINLDINEKRKNLNIISIRSTNDMSQKKQTPSKITKRQVLKQQLTKSQQFENLFREKVSLLNRIKANSVVYNYCCEDDTKDTLPSFRSKSNKQTQRKPVKSHDKQSQAALQKKMKGLELKLVVPEPKSKLVFLSNTESYRKPTASKYIFMDLLEIRAKAKQNI